MEGSGTSTEPFAAKAEFEACMKLREATNVDCTESDRYLRSITSSMKLTNGVGTVMVVVRLTPVLVVQHGSASSDLGGREACLAAVEDACKSAPAGSECTPKHVACRQDETGKKWSCEPLHRRVGELLVPRDPFSGDPFSGM